MSTCSIIKNRVQAEIKEYAPAIAVVALMLLPQAAFAGTNPVEDFFDSILVITTGNLSVTYKQTDSTPSRVEAFYF